jgi:two-component system NtrC family sensor kinase
MPRNPLPDDRQLKKGIRTLSLRNAIVFGLALGIVIPALLIGQYIARDSYQRELDLRVQGPLAQFASMLSQSMAVPVWHLDKLGAQTFINSVMLNPDVASIVVQDTASSIFVKAGRPELMRGIVVEETRPIFWDGEKIGQVTIQMSSHLIEQNFLKNLMKGAAAILLQLVISFVLLLMLFQRLMMRPLQQLQLDVDHLGKGGLDQPVQVLRHDELGKLALGVDSMRQRLGESMKIQANHSATLEQRVAERTTALNDSNQELRDTLKSLKNAQLEIQRSDRLAALGSLVAGVAHELNTPIGNSVTVASTLQAFSAEFKSAVDQGITRSTLTKYIENNTQASEMLLRNLHNAAELIGSFKQVAVDRTSAQRRKYKLDEVIKETILTMGAFIRKKSYDVQIEIAPEIEMDGYPGPLGQVITNLINNALIHGFDQREQGKVLIRAHIIEESLPASVELSVSDDGAGISSANLGRIFDPFFTTKLGQGGSGLGLNIVYNLIVDVLGGHIQVESTLGEGTRFIIQLPLSAPSTDKNTDI